MEHGTAVLLTLDQQSDAYTATSLCVCVCMLCMCAIVTSTGSKTAADDSRYYQAGRRKSRQTTQYTLRSLVRTRSCSITCSCIHTLSIPHSLTVCGSSDWLLLSDDVRRSLLLLFLFAWYFFVSRVCKEQSSELDRRMASAEELGACRIRSNYRVDTDSVTRWAWGKL